jgi:putative nucleotidyltransferase with HDIG domain
MNSTQSQGVHPKTGYSVQGERKLLILEALELYTLSGKTNNVLKVAFADPGSATDLAEVLSRDQAISGNILKIANSACFEQAREIRTISRAVVSLGVEVVKGIALSSSALQTSEQGAEKDPFDRRRLWTHSLACAFLSRKIADMTAWSDAETAFVCGLLHDAGKIVLNMHFPKSYCRVLSRITQEGRTSTLWEDEILGFTHAEVGMWLAQRWKFPKAVVFSIANHHGMIAEDKRYEKITDIVRLADHLCLQGEMCLVKPKLIEPIEDSIAESLSLSDDNLKELRDALAQQRNTLKALFER